MACPCGQTSRRTGERVLHFDGSATVGGVPNLEWLRRLDLRYTGLRGATKALEK